MIIAVFSLGQFFSSKLDVLKSGFTEWFKRQDKTEVTGEDVWKWMVDNLAPLRVGEITLDQFRKKCNEHFQVDISFTDFSTIFNSMCVLDKNTLDRLSTFKKFLDEHDHVKLVLVSHTNYPHLNFIQSQIESILPECKQSIIGAEGELSDTAQILFAPSMTSKCTEHMDTLNYALKKMEVGEEDQLVSFLNTVKAFEHPHFSYLDPGKELENVMATLDALENPTPVMTVSSIPL